VCTQKGNPVRKLLLILIFSFTASAVFGQATKPNASTKSKKTLETVVPLDKVIVEVQKALDKYQDNRGKGDFELPPLSSAEFDFKATTTTVEGVSINLFIFKFGGSHQTDVVNDVTYTYSLTPPPPPPAVELQSSAPPPMLSDKLAQMIQDAAKAVKGNGTVASLPFKKLTVNVQFGVTWDGKAEGDIPIYFVTIDLSGEAKKNSIQSVKLVFGQ
jgi:hypothetical protein